MKTFALICTICLTALTPSLTYSQGELSLFMGRNPSSRAYSGATGTHTALQYNILTEQILCYGLIIQDSRFASARATESAHISSLNGFVSLPLIQNSRIKPYLKMEAGVAYANSGPASELESQSTSSPASQAKFVSAQLAPAVGTQILLSRVFTLQAEYKRTLHYAHPLVAEGGYNFGTLDLGISYKFSNPGSKKRSYARMRTRCVYDRKTGATSCFKFK